MLRILFSCYFVLFSFISNAQLILDSEDNSKFNFNHNSAIYFGVDCLNNFRDLTPNSNHLSTELGERANEIPRWMSGYSLRIAIPILKFFRLNGGIAFQQNGESYNWMSSISDSSFAYQTSFRYIAMPVQISVEYGGKLGVYGALGVSPGIFKSFIQKQEWKNELGSTNTEEITIQNDCNSFIISVQGDLGLQYHINNNLGIQITGHYRKQLNNTYKQFEDYIHKAFAFGFNFAISYQF